MFYSRICTATTVSTVLHNKFLAYSVAILTDQASIKSAGCRASIDLDNFDKEFFEKGDFPDFSMSFIGRVDSSIVPSQDFFECENESLLSFQKLDSFKVEKANFDEFMCPVKRRETSTTHFEDILGCGQLSGNNEEKYCNAKKQELGPCKRLKIGTADEGAIGEVEIAPI